MFELTVIVTTYNAAKDIETCLTSIIDRKLPSLQLIIKDGGSTDDTLRIIKKYEAYINVLISERDNGIYDAMNKALPHIKGKWVLFLGADDKLLPGFSEMILQLKQTDTIYYGNCLTREETRGGAFSNYRLAKRNLCHQAILYPKAIFDKYTYQTQYKVFADYALNMQCWGDPQFKKQYLDIDVSYYNIDGFSSYYNDAAFRNDKPRLVKEYLGWWIYLRYRIKRSKESKKEDSRFF